VYQKQISQQTSPSLHSIPKSQEILPSPSYAPLSAIVQRVQQDPDSVSKDERQKLESAIGTKSTKEILTGNKTSWVPEFKGISSQLWGNPELVAPIQAKLTIGEVGNKYEQEADRVAKDVVQRINTSSTQTDNVQRQETEELQRKPLPEIVQRKEAIAGGEASTDLDNAINSARGSGQPLDPNLQQSMGQAIGADFSKVRVHTDSQADRLNRSIQAKAFTTGQDLFFRQGEYNPGSRGGQELIAHELTHVVQQNGDGLQKRKSNECSVVNKLQRQSTGIIQRVIAMTFNQVKENINENDALYDDLTQIGKWIDLYNTAAENFDLMPVIKMQQQFDLLRQIDRKIYHCMDKIGQSTLELDKDPIAKRLHTLHRQTEAEHEDLVENLTQTGSDWFGEFTPLDTTNIADMTPDEAQGLWQNIMSGRGKIKLVGDAAYNKKVRSWLTKLMDTKHGRELLKYLNTPNDNRGQGKDDELSNIYIGQVKKDIPEAVIAKADKDLEIQDKSKATPLSSAKSSLELDNKSQNNFLVANNSTDFTKAVLGGDRGITLNNAKYSFGQGTGSFVHIKPNDADMLTSAGRERLDNSGEREIPQVYKSDWITLGHELGHSANMRAGAGTENPGNLEVHGVFAAQWSGKQGKELQDFWHQGSEEFLNITNIENQIRQDVGLPERGAHSTPQGVMKIIRYNQILIDLKHQENDRYLGQLANESVKTSLSKNGLEAVRKHIQSILTNNPRTPDFPVLRAMAQRMAVFIAAWKALQEAHDDARTTGWTKLRNRTAWDAAQISVNDIGKVIIENNEVAYTEQLQRITSLTNTYKQSHQPNRAVQSMRNLFK
jgi:hypothetical protein